MNTKLIISRMDEFLRPLGFIRHKDTWNRKVASFIDVINLQASKDRDAITINAGVLHPEIHQKCWATGLPSIIQEPECIVRVRIGELIEDKDIWWEPAADGVPDDIVAKLRRCILPFLDQTHSFEAMAAFLMKKKVMNGRYPPPIIYLAILRCALGDKTGACELLNDTRAKTRSGAWRSGITEVMGRLGC